MYPYSAGIKSVVGEAQKTALGGMFDATCNACEMAVTWMQSEFVHNRTKEDTLEYVNRVSLSRITQNVYVCIHQTLSY